MSSVDKEKLRRALAEAGMGELSDQLLDDVAGGRQFADIIATCDESCISSCSQCCRDGSANRMA